MTTKRAGYGRTWVVVAALAAPVYAADSPDAGYYLVTRDSRYCEQPYCGGYFLRTLAADGAACADGSERRDCYVAEIDWSNLSPRPDTGQIGLFEQAAACGTLIVKGLRVPFATLGETSPAATLMSLSAQRAWLPAPAAEVPPGSCPP